MKRVVLSLVCASALAGMAAAPASAATSFDASACIVSSNNIMEVTVTWADQAPAATSGTVTFKYQFLGTYSGNVKVDDVNVGPSGTFTWGFVLDRGDSWDNYWRIKVSASGYFQAGPVKLTPDSGGWPVCSV